MTTDPALPRRVPMRALLESGWPAAGGKPAAAYADRPDHVHHDPGPRTVVLAPAIAVLRGRRYPVTPARVVIRPAERFRITPDQIAALLAGDDPNTEQP
jgi:hypothetical protein